MDKLIITDLDGTLLLNSVKIERQDLEKFREFQKKYIIGVATGRSIKEIEYIEKENGLKFTYKIGFNGAQIQKNDTTIFEKHMDNKILNKLYEFIKKHDLIFDALDGDQRIGNFSHENPKTLWNMELICRNDPYELLKGRVIYKVNIRPKEEESDAILNELKNEFKDLSIFKTAKRRIEVCANGLSKGIAIEKIKEKEPLYVISLGDSGNDISMFEKSDYAICMAHAPENVKIKANRVVERISKISTVKK